MSDVHPLGNTPLRTPEMFERYHDNHSHSQKGCFICEQVPIKLNGDFDLWKVTQNEFPYDAVAAQHFLLSPDRHVGMHDELTISERVQLQQIKEQLSEDGVSDCIIENLPRGRTFMPHYHLHLIQWKRV